MIKLFLSLVLACVFAAGPINLNAKNFNKVVYKSGKDTFVKVRFLCHLLHTQACFFLSFWPRGEATVSQ